MKSSRSALVPSLTISYPWDRGSSKPGPTGGFLLRLDARFAVLGPIPGLLGMGELWKNQRVGLAALGGANLMRSRVTVACGHRGAGEGKTHPCSSRSPQQHGTGGVFSCFSLGICQAAKWRMLFGPAPNLHITVDTLPCGGTSCLLLDVPVWGWS